MQRAAPRARGRATVLVACFLALAVGNPAARAHEEGAGAGGEARPSPTFRPATNSGDPIASSELTRKYAVDLTLFLRPSADVDVADLAWLDRMGSPPPSAVPAADSSDVELIESGARAPRDPPPAGERAAAPKPSGSIPGPVAATTALLGGLVLLVKVITEFLR